MTMSCHSKEIWKDIQGYEGIYQVSSHGRVRSLDRIVERKGSSGNFFVKGRVLTQSDDTHGYMKVNLTKHDQKRTFKVHRLVAIHFLDNPNNLPCVNHKDENKLNNNVDNLEWCTKEYNNSYGTKCKRQSETRKKLFREGKLKVWNKK